MRTIPNAFIANMSLSDLCMAAFNTSFNYVYMHDNRWDFCAYVDIIAGVDGIN